jgi:hypothetical protein
LITDLVKFYAGGLNYSEAKKMPLSELVALQRESDRINREIKAAMRDK